LQVGNSILREDEIVQLA